MRTVSTAIIFGAMVAVILLAANFAQYRMREQARANELMRGTQAMLQIGDAISTIVQGGRGSAEVSFSLSDGKISAVKAGRSYVSVNIGDKWATLISEPYTIFQYSVSYQNVFPPKKLFDRGARDKAYYNSTEASLIVYHYSASDKTYIVAEQRCFVWVAENEKLTIHIYAVKINTEEAGISSGRLIFSYSNEKKVDYIQYLPSASPITLYFESGSYSQGETLQLLGKAGQIVEIHAHIIEVNVTWQS